ncbi:MAG TPA: hypothetical protein VFD53_07745 [Ilumatobacter sp.]|jgi:hypothetical protein|nr:hypothetical protein [Ilumatobacter sp.]
MRRITALMATSVLLFAACGDDDDDDAGGVQAEAADEFIDQMRDEDVDPDEECVHTAFADMSDDDAQRIVDAESDETPDLSPEAMAIVTEATTSCASSEDLLDSIIESLPEGIDGDCVRDRLEDADFDEIVSSGTMPPEVEEAITECGAG